MKKLWSCYTVIFVLFMAVRLRQSFSQESFGLTLPIDGNLSSWIGLLLLFIAVLILIFALVSLTKLPKGPIVSIKSALLSFASTILCAAIFLESFIEIFEKLTVIDKSGNILSSPVFVIAYSVLGIITSINLIMLSFNFAHGKRMYAFFPYLSLSLPFWYAVTLVIQFVSSSEVSDPLERVFDVLAMIFILTAILTQSKILVGINTEKNIKKYYVLALLAGLFSFASSLPVLLGARSFSLLSSFSHFINLVSGFYILVFLFVISFYGDRIRFGKKRDPKVIFKEDKEDIDVKFWENDKIFAEEKFDHTKYELKRDSYSFFTEEEMSEEEKREAFFEKFAKDIENISPDEGAENDEIKYHALDINSRQYSAEEFKNGVKLQREKQKNELDVDEALNEISITIMESLEENEITEELQNEEMSEKLGVDLENVQFSEKE